MDDRPGGSTDVQIRCTMCGGEQFQSREAQLNTNAMTFFGLDWLNQSAKVLVCRRCGHLEWFLRDAVSRRMPEGTEPPTASEVAPEYVEDASEPFECPACGATIPGGIDRCPECRWSYKDPPDSAER